MTASELSRILSTLPSEFRESPVVLIREGVPLVLNLIIGCAATGDMRTHVELTFRPPDPDGPGPGFGVGVNHGA
jgi:hypothetical protein